MKTDKIKYNHVCQLCGHTWASKLIKPLSCPRCKRYDWNKEDKKGGEGNDSI